MFCNDEITKLLGICQKVVDEGYTITLPEHNAPGLLLKVVLGGVGWGAKMIFFPRISGFPPVRVGTLSNRRFRRRRRRDDR